MINCVTLMADLVVEVVEEEDVEEELLLLLTVLDEVENEVLRLGVLKRGIAAERGGREP